MNERRRITRRRWLISVLAFGLYVFCPPLRARSVPTLSGDAQRARLVQLAANQPSARIVGSAYLLISPDEASADLLFERLLTALPDGRRALNVASDHELRKQLLGAASDDFRAQRTVNLDGWIVSLTEARLCALAALSCTRNF